MIDSISRRVLRITPCQLAQWLPRLGSLLYLRAAPTCGAVDDLPSRVLVMQRASAPLLATRWLVAVSTITDDGPREWCECMDRAGHIRACLHLLPDTDYLAWDQLMAADAADRAPPETRSISPFRADSARVVNFHLQEYAGSMLLEQRTAASLSPCGSRVAERIAKIASVALL